MGQDAERIPPSIASSSCHLVHTRQDFSKPNPGKRSVSEDQEVSSRSEFSLIAGARDLADLGDRTELGNLQKKNEKKGWPKKKQESKRGQ